MTATAALQELTSRRMAQLADDLRQSAAQVDPQGLIRSGDWSNSAGLVNAYVSYYPAGDTSQEAIEAVVSLTPIGPGLRLSADICRSDGEIIAEIIERDVQLVSESETLSEVGRIIDGIQADLTERLRALLPAENKARRVQPRQTAD
jgi:hypothetical protein